MSEIDLNKEFADIAKAFEKDVSRGLEAGLDKAAKALAERLRERSPRRKIKGGKYARGWVIKSLRGRRYVGNKTTVKGKKSDTISLSNILEFGTPTMVARPHMRGTFDAMEDELADIIMGEISKSTSKD